MAQEPLYRRIPEDGKHPANSKKHPGAISGVALDDETNKPSGSSDFEPVEMSEEEYLRVQRQVAFWSPIVETVINSVFDGIECWWYTRALPKLEYEIIPSAKNKVVVWGKRTFGKQEEKVQPLKNANAEDPLKTDIVTLSLSADVDNAYQKYTINMSSEEAQKELLEAFVLQYLSMKKIQRLSHAKIIDADGNVITGTEAVEKLANSNVIKSINQMLSSNSSLLNEWEAKALTEALGRELIQDDHYVPIKRSELLTQINVTSVNED